MGINGVNENYSSSNYVQGNVLSEYNETFMQYFVDVSSYSTLYIIFCTDSS